MTQYCCVEGCTHSRNNSRCVFKRFPSDQQKCKLWENLVKREYACTGGVWKRTSWDRICECHFDDDQYEQNRQDGARRLRWDAVPRLFGKKAKVPPALEKKSGTKSSTSIMDQKQSEKSSGKLGSTEKEKSVSEPTVSSFMSSQINTTADQHHGDQVAPETTETASVQEHPVLVQEQESASVNESKQELNLTDNTSSTEKVTVDSEIGPTASIVVIDEVVPPVVAVETSAVAEVVEAGEHSSVAIVGEEDHLETSTDAEVAETGEHTSSAVPSEEDHLEISTDAEVVETGEHIAAVYETFADAEMVETNEHITEIEVAVEASGAEVVETGEHLTVVAVDEENHMETLTEAEVETGEQVAVEGDSEVTYEYVVLEEHDLPSGLVTQETADETEVGEYEIVLEEECHSAEVEGEGGVLENKSASVSEIQDADRAEIQNATVNEIQVPQTDQIPESEHSAGEIMEVVETSDQPDQEDVMETMDSDVQLQQEVEMEAEESVMVPAEAPVTSQAENVEYMEDNEEINQGAEFVEETEAEVVEETEAEVVEETEAEVVEETEAEVVEETEAEVVEETEAEVAEETEAEVVEETEAEIVEETEAEDTVVTDDLSAQEENQEVEHNDDNDDNVDEEDEEEEEEDEEEGAGKEEDIAEYEEVDDNGEELSEELEVEIEDCSDGEIEQDGDYTYIISDGMILVEEPESPSTTADAAKEAQSTGDDRVANTQKAKRILIKVPVSDRTQSDGGPGQSVQESTLEITEVVEENDDSLDQNVQESDAERTYVSEGSVKEEEGVPMEESTEQPAVTASEAEESESNSLSLAEAEVSEETASDSVTAETAPPINSVDPCDEDSVEELETQEALPDSVKADSVGNDTSKDEVKDIDSEQNTNSSQAILSDSTHTEGKECEDSEEKSTDNQDSEIISSAHQENEEETTLSPAAVDTSSENKQCPELTDADAAPAPAVSPVEVSERESREEEDEGQTPGTSEIENIRNEALTSTISEPESKEEVFTTETRAKKDDSQRTGPKHIKSQKVQSHSSKKGREETKNTTSLRRNHKSNKEERAKHNTRSLRRSSPDTGSKDIQSKQQSKTAAPEKKESKPPSKKPSSDERDLNTRSTRSEKQGSAKATVKAVSVISSGTKHNSSKTNNDTEQDVRLNDKNTIANEEKTSVEEVGKDRTPKSALRSGRHRKLNEKDSPGELKPSQDNAAIKKEKPKPSDKSVTPVVPSRQSGRVCKATEKAIASGLLIKRARSVSTESNEPTPTTSSAMSAPTNTTSPKIPRRGKRKAETIEAADVEDNSSTKRRTTRLSDVAVLSEEAQAPALAAAPVDEKSRPGSAKKGRTSKRKGSPLSEGTPEKRTTSGNKNVKDNDESLSAKFIATIPKMCRVCGSENENLLNVFGSEGQTLRLADKIHSILPIRMIEGEPLPTGVCHSCVVTLMACEKLVEKSVHLEKQLRSHFDCPVQEESTKAENDKQSLESSDVSLEQTKEQASVQPSDKIDTPPETQAKSAKKAKLSAPEQTERKRPKRSSTQPVEQSPVQPSKIPPTKAVSDEPTTETNSAPVKTSSKKSDSKSREKALPSDVQPVEPADQPPQLPKMVKQPPPKRGGLRSSDTSTVEPDPPVLEAEILPVEIPSSQNSSSAQPPVLVAQPSKPLPKLVPLPQQAVDDDPSSPSKRFGNTYRPRVKAGHWDKVEKGLELIHGESANSASVGKVEPEDPVSETEAETAPHPPAEEAVDEPHVVDLETSAQKRGGADETSASAMETAQAQPSSPKSVIDSILVDWSGDEDEGGQEQKSVAAPSSGKAVGNVNGPASSSRTPCLFGDDFCVEEVSKPRATRSASAHNQKVDTRIVKQEPFWPEPAPGEHSESTSENENSVAWKCSVCAKRGKGLSKFRDHKKLHQNDRKLVSCSKCSESFSNANLLKVHMKVHGDDDEDDEVAEIKQVNQVATTHQRSLRARPSALEKETIVDVDLTPDENGLYNCSLCQNAFTNIESLCQHKLIHRKDQDAIVYRCTVCRKTCFSNKDLQDHMASHKPGVAAAQLFQCARCDMRLTSQRDFVEHLNTHTEPESYRCEICDKDFDNRSKLRSHRSTVHKTTAYACHLCDKVCQKRITLIEHLRKHTGDNPFACPVCDKRFNRLANYKAHMMIHENARRYECPICGKRFNRQSIQQRHIKTHTNEQPRKHRCRVCNLTFNLATEMFNHRKLHTREEVERANWEDEKQRMALACFPCKVCQQIFNTVDEVLVHMPVHSNDERDIAVKLKNPQLECDICGKVLNSKRTFNAHRSSHIDGKPYVCKICQKGYSTTTGLNYHMLSHTGERPYPCTFCNKGYKNATDLKVHVRQHTGEFPYKCNLCNKAYRSASSLQKHGFVHTDERPHKCQFCNMTFKREGTKINHERIHTNDRRFKCKVCARPFIQKGACDAHEKLHFRSGTDLVVQRERTRITRSDGNNTLTIEEVPEKLDIFEDIEEEDFDEDDDEDDEYIIYEDDSGEDDDEEEEMDVDGGGVSDGNPSVPMDPLNIVPPSKQSNVLANNGVAGGSASSGVNITPVPLSVVSDPAPSAGDSSVHITIL